MIRARETARERVGELEGRDECVACGATDGVEVHHIDGDVLNNHPMNLIPLCHTCHRDTHRRQQSRERRRQMRQEFAELTREG